MPVHVHPENDIVEHELATDCACGPRVEWSSPDSLLPNGPLVIHHSMDAREFKPEVFIGRWLTTEVGRPEDIEEDDDESSH